MAVYVGTHLSPSSAPSRSPQASLSSPHRATRLFLSHLARGRTPLTTCPASRQLSLVAWAASIASLPAPSIVSNASRQDTPPRIFSFRQRPSQPPLPRTTHLDAHSTAVPSASGERSSSPRRLLSQCELLLQNSALVALPRFSAPQPAPPACAATAVAVPHRIPLARRLLARGKSIIFGAPLGRIPKTTHGATNVPSADSSPSPLLVASAPTTIHHPSPSARSPHRAADVHTAEYATAAAKTPSPSPSHTPAHWREPSPPPPHPLGNYYTHPPRLVRRVVPPACAARPARQPCLRAAHEQHGGDMQPLRACFCARDPHGRRIDAIRGATAP
ncbi:hypothetical protein C8J57DRAFT_1522237 [Mycena rebaudengoi]|nr:hypothetical protein C8J57DRAFT_1522237 [Mycena rebaudengoi]